MRISLVPPFQKSHDPDPVWVASFAHTAEALGFDCVRVPEHTLVVVDYEHRYPYSSTGEAFFDIETVFPDPIEMLAFVAARTSRIEIGTAVLVAPNHHPLMLAKRLATLDHLSQGRLSVGIGLGWMREEIEAFGVRYAERGRYTDELMRILRAMWSDESTTGVSFEGEFHQFEGFVCRPRSFEGRSIPLIVGGQTDAAARRAGRLGDGFMPLGLHDRALSDLVDLARREFEEGGRDPDGMSVVVSGGRHDVLSARDEATAVGATELMVFVGEVDLEAALDDLSNLAAELELHVVVT